MRKVLIVDDEEVVREFLTDVLRQEGYDVRAVSDAPRALDALGTDSFPVMFFDLMMPVTSGLDLCRQVRQRNPISVIFAMTGYPALFEVATCRSAGFDDYFRKPLDRRMIIKATNEAMARVERWFSYLKREA